MQVLDDNSENWLLLTDDGSTVTKTKSSNLNQLLFGHDLFSLLETGNEVWVSKDRDDEPQVTVIPDDEAQCYTLRVGDLPPLTLPENRKSDLIDALAEVYEDYDGRSSVPLVQLYDEVRGNMVRDTVLEVFVPAFGARIEERDDGWFINGHLLLNFEGEFHHPTTTSRQRSGQIVIGSGAAAEAYDVSLDKVAASMQREITVDGESYRLTEGEVEFLSLAMWAIENTPDRR
jgi:hypothetical protein